MSTLLRELELDAREHYNLATPAYAYMLEVHGDKEVRIEAPDIMCEFTRTVSLGRGLFPKLRTLHSATHFIADIRGSLYFHGESDLHGGVQCHVSIHSGFQDGGAKEEEVVVTSFWADDDDVTKYDPYAKV